MRHMFHIGYTDGAGNDYSLMVIAKSAKKAVKFWADYYDMDKPHRVKNPKPDPEPHECWPDHVRVWQVTPCLNDGVVPWECMPMTQFAAGRKE